MGRHSRPKGSSGADPIPEARVTPPTERPGPPPGGRRRRDTLDGGPGDGGGTWPRDAALHPEQARPQDPTRRTESAWPHDPARPQDAVPRQEPAPRHGPDRQHATGTPAFGTPQVRGGHPQHHEGGEPERHARPYPLQQGAAGRIPGPRRAYTEAFDGPGATGAPRTAGIPAPAKGEPGTPAPDATDNTSRATGTFRTHKDAEGAKGSEDVRAAGAAKDVRDVRDIRDVRDARDPAGSKVSKGRTFTGIAAAAVTTVLAVVVAGQVTSDGGKHEVASQSASDKGRADDGSASRGSGRSTPQVAPAAQTYDQKMAEQFPLDANLKGSGEFEPVPGADPAPGKGIKYRYRVDIEKGLGLDGALFAEAVQKTLNDDRSWAHAGKMTFERVSSGKPDFVITLASPGTTGVWCAKSSLDTTEDNVSCDSAATDRVMINAFRWAQGSETYGWGKAMLTYRQMLINHEVGHRLGHDHTSCRKAGTLAPVMQQQTKTLDLNGIQCLPNPWVYPTS
ncbi:DUF3152 domain-containing protein [Streptomyces sp. NPDC006660]|uniref:DUF3152 domain-containing protein n=1 Tax=Streptomyces sp. NPDC006660 TaxID=3156901 RepID=UPI00340CD155